MVSPNDATVGVLHVLFEQWKDEHARLDRFIEELNAWMTQEALQQAPEYAEAKRRLQVFDRRLEEHFSKEHAMGLLLAETRGIATPEIEELQRQADKEHVLLVTRLRELMEKLSVASESLAAWKSAVYEFGLLLDALEQHEELEADRVRWLMPSAPSSTA